MGDNQVIVVTIMDPQSTLYIKLIISDID